MYSSSKGPSMGLWILMHPLRQATAPKMSKSCCIGIFLKETVGQFHFAVACAYERMSEPQSQI